MALVVKDRIQETTTTTGTGTLTLLGAVTGYQSFAAVGNANTTYYTIASTSAEWEVGIGTYTASGTTLARTTILASSNAGSAVNLSAGTKNVFVTYPAGYSVTAGGAGTNSEFAATTALVFYQAAAPTGWTKSTTHDNKAMRVVSGTGGGSGGTTGFTTVFTNQTPTITTSGLSAGATTLTTAMVPAHTHTVTALNAAYAGSGSTGIPYDVDYNINQSNAFTTSSAFTGGSHTHAISGSATSSAVTLNVQYIDLIIASKD
jgi:hypothetical protein